MDLSLDAGKQSEDVGVLNWNTSHSNLQLTVTGI